MECMNENCSNELAGRQKTYCSDRCRKAQSRTEAKPDQSRTLVDACGKIHPIDFEGRRKDREVLESWAKGEGTDYQRSLGILAMKYSQIHGIDWPGSEAIMKADSDWCRGKVA